MSAHSLLMSRTVPRQQCILSEAVLRLMHLLSLLYSVLEASKTQKAYLDISEATAMLSASGHNVQLHTHGPRMRACRIM